MRAVTKARSQKRESSSPRIYKEVLDPNFEPPEEDVAEFAKRIGIDSATEPHLLHLSREGLKQGLPPNWKPCLEPVRNAWYYHDTTTKKSQWEHPIDAVFRQKVTSARSDHAMDRIQNFDPLTARPLLKSLPPLKKGGGSLAPLLLPSANGKPNLLGPLSAPPPNRLAPLGPLKSIGRLQPMTAQSLTQAAPPNNSKQLEVGKKLNPPSWLPDAEEGESAVIDGVTTRQSSEESHSNFGREVAKPKILLPSSASTGVTTSNGFINGQLISGTSIGRTQELLQKHIAQSTHCSSSLSHFLPLDSNSNQWNSLTYLKPLEEEEDRLGSLERQDAKTPIRAKGNVRFNLEDDFEFKFDTSSQASDRSSEEESEESSENTSDEEEINSKSDEDKLEVVSKQSGVSTNGIPQKPLLTPLGRKLMAINPVDPPIAPPFRPTVTKTPLKPAGELQVKLMGAGEHGLSMETDKEKNRMRLKMEEGILLFQQKLNEEQKKREAEIQNQLQGQLAKLKAENETIMQNRTLELENTMKTVLDKAKADQTESLKKEMETLTLENQQKIQMTKTEIQNSNEAIIHEINESVKLKKETLLAEKKRDLFQIVEQEVTRTIQELRDSLLADQKKQIDDLRTSHQHFIENLLQDFRTQEEQIREAHKSSIEELHLSFSIEKEKLIESFKTEPSAQIENIKLTNEKSEEAKHEVPLPNLFANQDDSDRIHFLEEKERELANTKFKYKMLQEKYGVLKSELTKVVAVEKSRVFDDRPRQISEDLENESFSVADETSSESVNDPTIQNDRLSRALGALESLRDQILDMNDEEGPTVAKQSEKGDVPAQRIEKEQKRDNFSARKSKQKLNVYPSNTNRITQEALTPSRDNDKHTSRDRRHQESVAQLKIVKEAKAFIKSQRHRLDQSVDLEMGFDSKRSYKDLLNQSETTESSGFGSLKRPIKSLKSPNTHKTQVGRDIEGILGSLKKLDSQMQSLWTMVGQQQIQGHGYLTPLIHPTSPAALAQFHILKENGAMDPFTTKTAHPLITNAELRTRYTITPPNQSASSAVVPDLSLLNNLVFNQNSKHVLSEQRQKFEATQGRIWKTYGPSDDTVTGKTKELRDWLRKF